MARPVYLVTGANRGIGFATCSQLANTGAQVLMVCRDLVAGREASERLAGDTHVVQLDLSDTASLSHKIDGVVRQHGPITGLINNAAVLPRDNLETLSPHALQTCIATNTIAPALLIQAVLPTMCSLNFGRIVNVSSGWGAFSERMSGPVAYAVSKAALNALTVSVASTLPSNVKINSVDPGWVKTRMGGEHATTSPQQAAETIVWLATLADDGPSGKFFRRKQQIPW